MLKVQEIREIIKLVDQSSITEFTYETNGTTIIMKKTGGNNGVNTVQNMVKPVSQQANEASQAEPVIMTEIKEENQTEQILPVEETLNYDYEIVSPMVGTLYRSSSPEIDPYVKKGMTVENETVVCVVEAMKLFNEIEAEVSGEIVEVLVEDGELVEYGQPLFRVKKK